MTTKRIPAKALLQTRLKTITAVPLEGLIDDLGLDVGRIEAVIQSLSAYKDDVFVNGILNLNIWMTQWPAVQGEPRESPVISWSFFDRFRPRRFTLEYDLGSGEYSAKGEEALSEGGRRLPLEISEIILDGLKNLVPDEDREQLSVLAERWRRHHRTE